MSLRNRRPCRHGFTLVELLVVIGIIVVLIGILMPVVGHVRKAAWRTSSQAALDNLAVAIERYRQDFNAYPGPIATGSNGTGFNTADGRNTSLGNMTMTENMVLGLLGGWEPGATPPSTSGYDRLKVGSGPMTHSPIASARKRYPAYMDFLPGKTLQMAYGANGAWDRPAVSTLSDGSYESNDRNDIPEFVDAFPDQMPIIYLRAAQGNPSYLSGTSAMGPTTQYNSRWVLPYTKTRQLADFGAQDFGGADAYFRNPAIGRQEDKTTWEVRQKDGFWLIAPGPDRIYGTRDDQTNFGSF